MENTKPIIKEEAVGARAKVVQSGGHGRMGENLHKEWDGYVDGKLVVFHMRKWVVRAVVDAIVAGHIAPEGDTVMSLSAWAAKNDEALYARIVRTGVDGFQ